MRTRPLPRNFASGELAPWVDGITSQLTQQGARTLENWIVKKQGQATRRPGTFHVADTKNDGAAVLVPVIIDDNHRYVLEVGDAYIRVYDQPTHAYLTEITSPWSVGELATLVWQYVADEKALYWVQGAHQEQRLVYSSGTSWALSAVPILQSNPPVIASWAGRTALSLDVKEWKENHVPGVRPNQYPLAALIRGRNNLIGITDGSTIAVGDREGENWIVQANILANSMHGGFSNGKETVLVGDNASGSSGTLAVSNDDGLTWTEKTGLTNDSLYAVGYEASSDSWMAVGKTSRCYFYGADDPTVVSVTEVGTLFGVWGDSTLWVAVGPGTIHHATSVTGAFTSIAMSGTLYGVTKGFPDNADLWIAVGTTSGGNAVIYTSPTGTIWTQRYNSAQNSGAFTGVKWISNAFVAVGQSLNGATTPWQAAGATGTIVATSPDGITWTVDPTLSRTKTWGWLSVAFREETEITNMNLSANLPYLMTFHEGRTILVNKVEPSNIYGSRIGVLNNFFLGETSQDAYSYKLAGRENADIQWIMGGQGALIVGTRTAEGILAGSPDEGITPLTAQFRWLSTFGSANIQPVRIHDTIVFVQRGGEIIRGYVPSANAYQSPELTAYADHIGSGGIVELDHQDDPQSMVYALRGDGQLPVLTFDNNLRAWSRIKAAPSAASAGVIESTAVIPTTGAEDEVWQITKRTIGGGTKRHIEYYAPLAVPSFAGAHYLDDGVEVTSGTTFQTIGGLTHLAAENVDALVNGSRWISGLTVAASGTITIAPYSGTDVHVGLPYTSYLQTMRADYGSPFGAGAGLNKRTSALMLWVSDSSALAKFGPTTTTAVEDIAYVSSTALNTDVILYPFPGESDRDGYIWCVVDDPRPFTLVGVLADSETGDR